MTTSQQCGFCVVCIAVKRQSVTLTLAATLTRNISDKHSKPKHNINSVKWLPLTPPKKNKSRENLPPFFTTNKIICSSCVQTNEVTVDAVAWQRIISRDNGSAGPRTEPKSTKAVGHYRVYYKLLIFSIWIIMSIKFVKVWNSYARYLVNLFEHLKHFNFFVSFHFQGRKLTIQNWICINTQIPSFKMWNHQISFLKKTNN